MDPGVLSVAAVLVPVGSWSLFCTFRPTGARFFNIVHPGVSRGTDSGVVVVCAPICVVCRGSPLCAVAGLAGFSSTSTKEICPLPPRTHRRRCP